MNDIMNEFVLMNTDDFFNDSFFEFCHTIESILQYREFTELILEAVDDPAVNRKGRLARDLQATANTTRNAAMAVNGVIDAKATVYGATANLVFKLCGYAGKLFGYLANKVSSVINGASRLVDDIGKIPEKVRATIKGDIKLYITVGDVKQIYNQSIINKIDSAIAELQAFTSGDSWGYLFHPNKIQNGEKQIKSDDMKHSKTIKSYAASLQNIHFSESIVKMDIPENRDAYFSNAKVVAFTDLHGKAHNDSYMEALRQLITDLTSRKEAINELQKAFGEKVNRTELNSNWASIGRPMQQQINDTMKDAAVIIGVIGEICKYVTVDMKTIDNSVKKVLNKYKDGNK